MRKVISERSFLGSTDIGAIELDAKSRDDIPALLIGLQAICMNEETRTELFRLLDAHVLPGRRRTTGRPGMDLWRILAVGVLKQGLRCDFDRLREIADRHADDQAFPGHDVRFDPCRYELRTIRDNVALPAPEILGKAGDLVAASGQEILGKKPGATFGRPLRLVRGGDGRPLSDRCQPASGFGPPPGPGGVAGLRILRRSRMAPAAALGRQGRRAVRRREDGVVAALPAGCRPRLSGGVLDADRQGRGLAAHVRRFANQIRRRVLRGKTIPQGEKVFSIFEEHTRWISKGKADKKVEPGVPVCIVEDGNGFVLGHEIMWTGGDADVAVPLVERCRKAFPDLRGCSFDRGFHSPSNRKKLDDLLDPDALPKKGRLSAAEREREADPAFAAARRKHSGVESAINSLEHRGLDRVRLRGPDGFERAVGLSVLASNLHRIGQILRVLRGRERERMRQNREPLHQYRRLRAA